MVPNGKRKRKRWPWFFLLGLVAILGGGVAVGPWFLGTGPGRRWLLARVERVMAPHHLRFQAIHATWRGPITLKGLELSTGQGKRVASVPRASWDRGVWGLLTDPNHWGTLTLFDPRLAVEKRSDGSIDLAEALKPLLKPSPRRDFRIKLVDGSLIVQPLDAHLGPIQGDHLALDLHLPPIAQGPATWQFDLQSPDLPGSSFHWTGNLVRSGREGDPLGRLHMSLDASAWPIPLVDTPFGRDGRLTAAVKLDHDSGAFHSTGTLHLDNLKAAQGGSLIPIPVRLDWAVSRSSAGWMVGETDHINLEGSGDFRDLGGSGVPGKGDLLGDLSGRWTLNASARRLGEAWALDGSWEAPDLRVRDQPIPLALTLRTVVLADLDRLNLDSCRLVSGESSLQLTGKVENLSGTRDLDLSGTWTPDWPSLNRFLVERVEPGASVAGRGGSLHLKGRISGDSLETILGRLDGEARVDLDGAKLIGMTLGPAPIAVRAEGGQVAIDPIRTTLNGGTLHLDPEWSGSPGSGGMIRLKAGSGLEDAEINDEVSRRVLAYVAPVLDAATRAHGKVSAEVSRAEFPIGEPSTRHSLVEGRVVFREAEFVPGPLVEQLVRMLGRDEARSVRLDQPVVLSIADGRVSQKGLALPLGQAARLELDGSVGFDRTLNLVASVPITNDFLANRPVLNRLAAGTRLVIPIGGTLDQPKVDKDAFNLALRQTGQNFLQNGLGLGAAGLLEKMLQPRPVDPNAPPPPTAEERRALREQRKADRQRRRAERRGEIVP